MAEETSNAMRLSPLTSGLFPSMQQLAATLWAGDGSIDQALRLKCTTGGLHRLPIA